MAFTLSFEVADEEDDKPLEWPPLGFLFLSAEGLVETKQKVLVSVPFSQMKNGVDVHLWMWRAFSKPSYFKKYSM